MEFTQNYIIFSIKELMNSVIIVAAGIGSRLGGKTPKQFIELDSNKSILHVSVEAFLKNKLIDENTKNCFFIISSVICFDISYKK